MIPGGEQASPRSYLPPHLARAPVCFYPSPPLLRSVHFMLPLARSHQRSQGGTIGGLDDGGSAMQPCGGGLDDGGNAMKPCGNQSFEELHGLRACMVASAEVVTGEYHRAFLPTGTQSEVLLPSVHAQASPPLSGPPLIPCPGLGVVLDMDCLAALPGSTGSYGSALHDKVQRLCDALIGGGGAERKRRGIAAVGRGDRQPGGAEASGEDDGGSGGGIGGDGNSDVGGLGRSGLAADERQPGGAVASGSGEGGGGGSVSGNPASRGDAREDNAKAERSGGISPSPGSYDFCVLHVREDGNAGIDRGIQAKVRGVCVAGMRCLLPSDADTRALHAQIHG